jgi:tRNA1Val (adenine37-N6)-methyltransferase
MIFRFKAFEVKHSDSLLKVNTDAVLLGALVKLKPSVKNILDIGTGCGLIALMLAQKFELAMVDGIELDEPSFKEAAFNFSNSNFSKRLNAYHGSLQKYSPLIKYDLIVSNPPYFEITNFPKGNNTQDISENRKKLATQFTLTFEELISKAAALLSQDGVFWVIIPFDAKEKFERICSRDNLFLQHEIFIQSKPGHLFHRCVLGFGRKAIDLVEREELIIYNSDGTRHTGYIAITSAFYL